MSGLSRWLILVSSLRGMLDVVFLNSWKTANGLGLPRIWELFPPPARLYDHRLLRVAIYGNHLTPTSSALAYVVYVFGRKIWQRLRCALKIDGIATWLRNSDVRQNSFQNCPSSRCTQSRPFFYYFWSWERVTRWRSWLRHCATSWKVAGSIPDDVFAILLLT